MGCARIIKIEERSRTKEREIVTKNALPRLFEPTAEDLPGLRLAWREAQCHVIDAEQRGDMPAAGVADRICADIEKRIAEAHAAASRQKGGVAD